MPRWTRPYQHTPRALVYARAFLVSLALVAVPIYVADQSSGRVEWTRFAPLVAFVALLVVLVWCHVRVGLDVGERGIRVQTMGGRRIIAWRDVQRVLVVEDPRYRNWVLAIVTWDGVQVSTPICQRAFRILRAPGPFGCVKLPAAELEALGHALDSMATARNREIRI